MTVKYKHGEAFCIMTYACKHCGHRERVWNSRDGVTPFGMSCPSCGEITNHVDWGMDKCAPNHKPLRFQKFWRDGTLEEAEVIIRRRNPPEDIANMMLEEARRGKGEFQTGWPMLDINLKG